MLKGLIFSYLPQPSTNVIRKSEIHLVICEIAFPIRNTFKKLFEVEF
jgi:hypothetical protein